jgi:hypothetical protein
MAMGGSNPIISGSGMAILLGFFSALGAVVVPEVSIGNRILMFGFGVVVLFLGLMASTG